MGSKILSLIDNKINIRQTPSPNISQSRNHQFLFLLHLFDQPRLDPGYQMDALLRVRNCLYAHYTGPMSYSNLASQKLDIYAFEHEIETTGDSYTVYVNQDDDNGVLDVFMETK